MLRVGTYIRLCVDHVDFMDTELLRKGDEHSIGYSYPNGFFIAVPDSPENLDSLLAEMADDEYSVPFRQLISYCFEAGVQLLLLDADGPVDKQFPVFDWFRSS